jgi:hypothetical protein
MEYSHLQQDRAALQAVADRAAAAGAGVFFSNFEGTEIDRINSGQEATDAVLRQWLPSQDRFADASWSLTHDAGSEFLTLSLRAKSRPGPIPALTLPVEVASLVELKGGGVEVALLLDSSASMFEAERFNSLRMSAKDLANALFDLGGKRMRISVVPWASLVNINSEAVAPVDPTPMAETQPLVAGSRRLPPPPGMDRLPVLAEPRDPAQALTAERRIQLSQPAQWRGCIRAAPDEASIGADGTVIKTLDDKPPVGGMWPAALLEPSLQPPLIGQCVAWQEVESPPPAPIDPLLGRPTQTRFLRQGAKGFSLQRAERVRQCVRWTYSTDLHQCLDRLSDTGMLDHQNGALNAFQSQDQGCSDQVDAADPVKTGVNLACLSDPNERAYLQAGGRVCPWQADGFSLDPAGDWSQPAIPIAGPNLNCPAAILPLSGNRQQVLDKLDELYPVPGGSQSDIGLAWGLRTLSPSAYWTQFWGLPGGLKAKPYKSETRKFAVLYTDGRNMAPIDYEGYYGCTRQDRKAAGPCWRSSNIATLDEASLDRLTVSACQQLQQAYDIELYVVLVNVADDGVRQAAVQCTGRADHVLTNDEADMNRLFYQMMENFLSIRPVKPAPATSRGQVGEPPSAGL